MNVNPLYLIFPEHRLLISAFVVAIGACVGSFLSVCIWRLPRYEDIVFTPSHCPACGHHIPFYRNVPILGWLMLGGRCASCRVRISPRYLMLEVLTAILFLLMWLRVVEQGWPLSVLIVRLFLIGALVVVSFIDLDHRIIPDRVTLTMAVAALLMGFGFPDTLLLPSCFRNEALYGLMQRQPLTFGFARILAQNYPIAWQSPRVFVALHMGLGMVFGGGFLWLVSEVGKLAFGRRRIRLPETTVMTVNQDGFDVPDEGLVPWEDIFTRDSDRLSVHGTLESLSPMPEDLELPCPGPVEISDQGVVVGDRRMPLEELVEARIRTGEWVEPREAMGMGDVKLMAVLGLLLGPGGVIFVFITSCLLGAAFGLAWAAGSWLFRGRWASEIPFGPYIAVAAAVYLLRGAEVAHLYREVVLAWLRH